MSTDKVLVTATVAPVLEAKILAMLDSIRSMPELISTAAKAKVEMLVSDARDEGARFHTPAIVNHNDTSDRSFPPTVVTGLTPQMKQFEIESFGPMVGIMVVETEVQIKSMIKEAKYGLSGSIISRNICRSLELAQSIKAGAVHINSMTLHGEPTLPYGGYGDSGWGRFGAHLGMEEFVQTKVVTLHP
jgi:acyl-CoA reductase-like NAD-dependent aldehyde dehydrogenase